tara:strand:- start:458 stop:1195 length:738 start_codon:yes stop_codon:yes gene_type:complete
MIDQDLKQRVKVCGIFFLQVYKIMTGTMLSLFLPQDCGDHMCTLTDNYNNSEIYHRTVFSWNCLSAFSFCCTYLIELYREEWCVKYLDVDNNIPDNSLKGIIIKEKKLDKKMDKLNLMYYRLLCVNTFIYFVNMILTLKMMDDNYYNNSTLSCFISFSLLVMMKLYNSLSVGYQSVKNDKMMSAFMSEFISYNVIDGDYVKEKYNGTKNNRLEDITKKEEKKDDIKDDIKDDMIKEEEIIPIVNN